jgi:hypothetical protein
MPDYWGRPTQTPILPIMLERAMYAGALPLMLAAVALTLRRTQTKVAVAVFGAFWFAVAVGIPPIVQIVTRLPVFNSGHNTRVIVFFLLCLALLAGWGLDALTELRPSPRARRRLALVICAVLLLIPVAIVAIDYPSALTAPRGGLEIAWLFKDPPGEFGELLGIDVIRASALIIWLTMAGAALLLIALRLRGRIGASAFVVLALLLLCVDLFRIGMGQNPAIDRDLVDLPATGAVRLLERQGTARFVSTREFPHNVLAHRFDLYEARGYDIPIVRRFDRLWRQEVVPGEASVAAAFLDIPLELRDVTPRALRTLRLLGVTHLIGPSTVESGVPPHLHRVVPVPPLHEPGLRLVYDRSDARVYRLEGAMPRAWVVGAQRTVAGDGEALHAITRPNFDARATAITQSRLDGLPQGTGASAGGGGEARITSYEPERVTVRARSRGQGLLVLSDNQYPGWNATVDGRSVPIERVDYLFRGVRVGPGSHTVEFRYQPLSFRVGWIVSLVSLVALAATAAFGWRRRRAAERPVARTPPTLS